jgi:hypothetical protein
MSESRKLGVNKHLLAEREPFFELDDVEYTLPKKIPGKITLDFLEMQRDNLPDSELVPWLLDEIVGDGTYDALHESETVDAEELGWVFEQIAKRITGELEKARGKSRNGSSRSAGS